MRTPCSAQSAECRMQNAARIGFFMLVVVGALGAASRDWHSFSVLGRNTREFRVQVTMQPWVNAGDSAVACSRLIAVPTGTMPEIAVLAADSVLRSEECRLRSESGGLVWLGEPVRFRDLELVPLNVRRVRGLADGTAATYSRVELKVRIPAGEIAPRQVPAGFAELYRSAVLNMPDVQPTAPEGYLMIVPDAFFSNAQALARWKELKGYHVSVKRLSEVGSNADQIRAYISTAYHTWPVPPEYVLLMGTIDQIPAFTIPRVGVVTDHTYGCLDGNDFFPEVLIGRLPANSGAMLDYQAQRILHYERTPVLSDTSWFRQALMVATLYQEGGTPTVTALETKRWVRDLMLQRGFLGADTVFDPPYSTGPGVQAKIDSCVDAGVCFINGRGWGNSGGWNYPEYRTNHVSALNNGWRLPVVTSLYCGTGAFSANPCFGEAWLQAGSPSQPRGAVAFFGPSWLATSTRWNNCLDYGIYHGILNEGISTLGPAMLRGKLELFQNFPLPEDSTPIPYLRAYWYSYNILGDPSLQMWTGTVPQAINASLPSPVLVGQNTFAVGVSSGAGTRVSLVQGTTTKSVGLTDATGHITLTTATLTSETLFVTITRPDYLPYEAQVVPQTADAAVWHNSHSPMSFVPGQAANLSIELKNFGSSRTATAVVGRLRCVDTLVTIQDSVQSFGDIAPGAVASAGPFTFSVAAGCTSGHQVTMEIAAQSQSEEWVSAVPMLAQAAKFGYRRCAGTLSPGQATDVSATILNRGVLPASGVTGTLVSLTGAAVVEDADGSFGDIAVGDSATNAGDAFRVRVQSEVAVGRVLGFELQLAGVGGFSQTLHLDLTVGPVGPDAPLGPDAYGYYAYDDIDVAYAEHPLYNWIEIDPSQGGAGTLVPLANEQTRTLWLPFVFRHYGNDYYRIAVSDNGFLACDSTRLNSFYNWRIPSAYGPPGVIAPFWDDFRTDTLGASGVYHWFDALNHCLVIEWSRVVHIHGFKPPVPAEQQTFQAVLFDPAYYATPSGDGPILFQYQTVFNDDTLPGNNHNRASVGIANREQTAGLQCTYADSLSPGCGPLGAGRAIRFTTVPPDSYTAIAEREPRPETDQAVLVLPANPVRSPALVSYALPAGATGRLRVCDVAGRVLSYHDLASRSGTVLLDRAGSGPGVYYINLTLPNQGRIISISRKLVVASD